MSWNITDVSGNLAELKTTSQTFNVTNGRVIMFQGGSTWTVNEDTREIVKTMTGVNVTGLLEPFWISPNVSVGSLVDAYFGAYSQVQQAAAIKVMGQTRDCWKVTLNWPGSTMQRWYDRSTGIVLLIVTNLTQEGIQMDVTETAIKSDIQMLAGNSGTNSSLFLNITELVIGAGVVAGGWMYLRHRNNVSLDSGSMRPSSTG